jgi:hypothetical protein
MPALRAKLHHHHHQITKLSHDINAIGPAPHRGGRKREHRSIMIATITHIPSLHKICRNAPRYHPTNPLCKASGRSGCSAVTNAERRQRCVASSCSLIKCYCRCCCHSCASLSCTPSASCMWQTPAGVFHVHVHTASARATRATNPCNSATAAPGCHCINTTGCSAVAGRASGKVCSTLAEEHAETHHLCMQGCARMQGWLGAL